METIQEIPLNIAKIAAKRGALMKLNYKTLQHKYNFTDLHTLDYIGRHKNANITKISNHFGITRGAICKVTKKLIRNQHIESYKNNTNKKEIYYKLTSAGKMLFNEHNKVHKKFENIELDYFKNIDVELLESINNLLTDYNKYLTDHTNLFTS